MKITLPWLPIALIGTAVAFVVGFKNNATYGRMWEARQIWGAIVNASRSWGIMVRDYIVVQGATMSEQELSAIKQRLVYRHIGWLTALRFQLRESRTWEHLSDVSKAGVCGEINRIGQTKPSACCGAAKAALGRLLAGNIKEGEITELDYQQNHIEQILFRSRDRIKTAANPLVEATKVMYEAIEERIIILAERTEYPCRYLILMGGILINGDYDMGSFNSLQRFDVVDLISKETHQLKEILLHG